MAMLSPRRQPAEWATHRKVWIGWPSAADLWEDDLSPARREVAALIRAVLFPDPDDPTGERTRGEPVALLARGPEAREAAEAMRGRLSRPEFVSIHEAPLGDIWLRDTGPIFSKDAAGADVASAFAFNGWGGKYRLPEDDRIADIVAALAGVRLRRFPDFIGEGGAVETDGEGTVITTRQCLLNANRNPGLSEKDVEGVLKAAIGAEKVIWLDEGLSGDHTDGHIDNIARFVAPGKVVCMLPYGENDPNTDVLKRIRTSLSRATDAAGRRLDVIEMPSPGLALMEGEPVPASHMNFYIANRSVIVPTYAALTRDDLAGEEALSILDELKIRPFVIGIDSSHLLTGGGSFHCISQQEPE
jgi:agmatine deiminase